MQASAQVSTRVLIVCASAQCAPTLRTVDALRALAPYAGAVQITGDDALTLTGVFIVIGSIGFPIVIAACATERIRLNRFIGFRSEQILVSPATWRGGHQAALVPVALASAAALLLGLTGLLVPFMVVRAIALFIAAVALFGGGLLALTRANEAAERIIDGDDDPPRRQR